MGAFVMNDYKKRGYTIDFLHIPSGRSVSFRALVTAFSDKYTSEWKSESVYGRNDPIENFKSTNRKISFSWKVVSESLEVAKENMKNVSLLLSMLYPTYSGNGASSFAIATSPVLKLRFSNLIQNVNGAVQSSGPVSMNYVGSGLVGRTAGFSYDPDFGNDSEGIFDLAENKLYPKTLSFSCEYTVYHTHPVGWSVAGDFLVPRFPYGDEHGGSQLVTKNPKVGATSGGTKEHQEAKQDMILGSVPANTHHELYYNGPYAGSETKK